MGTNVSVLPGCATTSQPWNYQQEDQNTCFFIGEIDYRSEKKYKSSNNNNNEDGDSVASSSNIPSIDKLASLWMPNEMSSECMLCSKPFSIFRRKHHCRSCGRLICNPCSSHLAMVEGLQLGPHRVCDECLRQNEGPGGVIRPPITEQ
eukprot:c2629_g1_i1.p1 GENE.c2629_g1_i1~~c2629_g1_i1.p1  ORF type:complete len:148 (-),score=71.11 c2629_g1_i1:32-475(-)